MFQIVLHKSIPRFSSVYYKIHLIYIHIYIYEWNVSYNKHRKTLGYFSTQVETYSISLIGTTDKKITKYIYINKQRNLPSCYCTTKETTYNNYTTEKRRKDVYLYILEKDTTFIWKEKYSTYITISSYSSVYMECIILFNLVQLKTNQLQFYSWTV